MEITRASQQESETTHTETKEREPLVETTTYLVILTAALSILDLSFHQHGGVSDPERRKMLTDLLGPLGWLVKHLGNYGFSSALAISAVFAKNIVGSFVKGELGEKILHKGLILSAASLLTLNALIETFPQNGQLVGDITVGAIGVILSTVGAELAIQKFKKAKRLKKKALAQKSTV